MKKEGTIQRKMKEAGWKNRNEKGMKQAGAEGWERKFRWWWDDVKRWINKIRGGSGSNLVYLA